MSLQLQGPGCVSQRRTPGRSVAARKGYDELSRARGHRAQRKRSRWADQMRCGGGCSWALVSESCIPGTYVSSLPHGRPPSS